jgi:hypothetical protein
LSARDPAFGLLSSTPNGRTNIGTVSLARANWLPAPEGQFALIVRAYVPTAPILDGSYKLPNVERAE